MTGATTHDFAVRPLRCTRNILLGPTPDHRALEATGFFGKLPRLLLMLPRTAPQPPPALAEVPALSVLSSPLTI